MSRVVILFHPSLEGSIGLMTYQNETEPPMFEERLDGLAQFVPSVNDPHPVCPERLYERGWEIVGEYHD